MHDDLSKVRDKKARSDLNYVWTQLKDVEIVGEEIQLINSVLVRIKISRMWIDCVEDASIAMCENVQA